MKTKQTPYKCPVCNGKGDYDKVKCKACDGKGLVWGSETESYPTPTVPWIEYTPITPLYPYFPYPMVTWCSTSVYKDPNNNVRYADTYRTY
jgi:hypothetical protein